MSTIDFVRAFWSAAAKPPRLVAHHAAKSGGCATALQSGFAAK
jgi:hypothetical protein